MEYGPFIMDCDFIFIQGIKVEASSQVRKRRKVGVVLVVTNVHA